MKEVKGEWKIVKIVIEKTEGLVGGTYEILPYVPRKVSLLQRQGQKHLPKDWSDMTEEKRHDYLIEHPDLIEEEEATGIAILKIMVKTPEITTEYLENISDMDLALLTQEVMNYIVEINSEKRMNELKKKVQRQ